MYNLLALCCNNASERFTLQGYGGLGQDWKGYKTSSYKQTWNLENWDTSSAFTHMNTSLLQVRSCTCFILSLIFKGTFYKPQ